MRAGALRHYVTLLSREETDDGMGGRSYVYATWAYAWASMVLKTSRELLLHHQLQEQRFYEFTMRWMGNVGIAFNPPSYFAQTYFGRSFFLSGPAPVVMRFDSVKAIQYDTRVFDIQSVNNVDERNRQAIVIAKENPAT